TLPTGAVSHLFYADRLYQLPLGVVGIAVATTLLPILSQHIAEKSHDKTRHYFSRAVEFALTLGLPAGLGLMLAAEPIIQTLFERGAFTRLDTAATAQALACYAMGVPAFLLVKIFSTVFFAHHNTATPMRIALLAIAANIGLSLSLPLVLGSKGLALAAGLATWINAAMLFIALKKNNWVFADDGLRMRLPKLLACALTLAAVIVALKWLLNGFFTNTSLWHEMAGLGLLLAGSALAFLGLTHFSGAVRWRDIPQQLKRQTHSKTITDHELS
ncbi:MAG: lipid II flippase MurJ, partial [Alphaproteobacteria bacterium]|nr:lipid II flippase MurJ [Alphaproteobacteria bacterium]